jgi:type IV pilus assembly protein PilC
MAEWVWEARARSGELKKGSMEADDEEGVNTRLRSQQLTPTKVKKKGKAFSFGFGSGVSGKDIVTFTRLFATMIDAGLPIVQCLEILQGQTENPTFAGVLKDVKSSVEQGSTFSDALRRHPKVFDPLYTNLIQAGEVGGILDTIMNRLAVYNEKNMKLKRQVKGAMIYPSSVVVIFTGVLCVLLGFVIPSFKKIFTDLGSPDDLPVLTQYVITVSEAFTHNFFLVVGVGIVVVYALVRVYRTPKGKKYFHRILLRIPIMGPVMRKIAVARFTRTCGTLLSSGVPILDALEIVAKTAGNVVVEDAIMYARLKISEGKNMAGPLMETDVFPPMVVQMVGVGEQTGALDAMLSKIADFYEDEVAAAIKALTSILEPAMIIIVGGIVGVIVISMYLPLFDVYNSIP